MVRRIRKMRRAIQFFSLWFLCSTAAWPAGPEYPRVGPDLFDPKADGEALLADALVRAAKDGKLALLFLGANWCPYSRRIDRLFRENPDLRAEVEARFIVAPVDVNFRRKPPRNTALLARLDQPLRSGLPVLLLMHRDGRRWATLPAGEFAAQADEEMARRLLAALTKAAASAETH